MKGEWLVAKAGDIITCENGHVICEVAADIKSGDMLSVTQFKNWTGRTPQKHEKVEPCHVCGADWLSYSKQRNVVNGLHKQTGWRVSQPDIIGEWDKSDWD